MTFSRILYANWTQSNVLLFILYGYVCLSLSQVCADALAPLVSHALEAQGSATLICYGQTGTGKTYTLMGALAHVARAVEQAGHGVGVTFFEIHGKKCLDLLDQRKPLKLLSDAQDTVHVRGARQVHLEKPTAEEFSNLFRDALALRSVEVTERNPISSRSHAVCRLQLDNGGKLNLVDLAGSERNYEVTQMTSAQHRESAYINKALMALKDCFRAYAKNKQAQTRQSRNQENKPAVANIRAESDPSEASESAQDSTQTTQILVDKAHQTTKEVSRTEEKYKEQEQDQVQSTDPIPSEVITPTIPPSSAAPPPTTTGTVPASGRRPSTNKQQYVPYRASMLTRVLRECFVAEAHMTAVIGVYSVSLARTCMADILLC